MSTFDNLKDKAAEAMEQNSDKVEQISDQGIERAGDVLDERTGGDYSEKVDLAQEQADQRVGDGQ